MIVIVIVIIIIINRGYYTVARRYEFYVRVARTIVTSLNDTTLTKVTYRKYATRVPDEVAYGIYEWFSSQ